MIPVFLLLAALVVDAGNWYTHKRSLQNRADAGALAAGLEYIKNNNLRNCVDGARQERAHDRERRQGVRRHERCVGRHDLQQERQQSERTSRSRSTRRIQPPLDWTDGGSPCAPTHGRRLERGRALDRCEDPRRRTSGRSSARSASASRRSPRRRASRSSRSSASPRTACRSSTRPATRSSASGRSSSGRETGHDGLHGYALEPGPAHGDANHIGRGNITNVKFTNAHDDVAIQYWAGSKNGSAPCTFARTARRARCRMSSMTTPARWQIDWLNVYDTGRSGAPRPAEAPSILAHADNCGGPGFLYTATRDPTSHCTVGFTAEVDTGVNNVRGSITLIQSARQSVHRRSNYDTTGGNPNLTTVTGTITVLPTTSPRPTRHDPRITTRSAHMTSMSVGTSERQRRDRGNSNCPGGKLQRHVPGRDRRRERQDIQQQFYMADPLASAPLIATT